MPAGNTKFQPKWLESRDKHGDLISNWCTTGRHENEAFCILCKNYFSIANQGMPQLLQHSLGQKHRAISKNLKGQKKLSSDWCSIYTKDDTNSQTSSINLLQLSNEQMVVRAEALWAMKVAACNYSFSSCKELVPLFQRMFEGHPAGNQMQLCDRKMSYILSHGLGPYFQDEIINELKMSSNWFTLAFDETTTCQIKKQLDIYLRFWSEKSEKVINVYINSIFLGHAEANKVYSGILQTLNENKLPLSKLLMLSMDGPNVNRCVAKKLNVELSVNNLSELVDFGTCSLHKIHNCFSKTVSNISLDIDEFINDLFAFFKLSAARREDLREIQKFLQCEQKFLLRHINSRWLTLGTVINRIIAVYPSLHEYFLNFLPQQKLSFRMLQQNSRYKRILSNLKDPSTIIYLEFLSDLTPQLEAYLALFQMEGPLVHILFNKMNELLRNIMQRFLKQSCVGTLEGKYLLNVEIENSENFKPLKEIDIGLGARKAISKLKESERTRIRMELRKCLIVLAKCLKETLPISDSFLKNLEILHPFMRKDSTDNAVVSLCEKMKPLNLSNQLTDHIVREWQIYRLDKDVEILCDDFMKVCDSKRGLVIYERVDAYWNKVLKLTNKYTGRNKYQNLSLLVKSCLSLSHGNADVERGFSINNWIVTSERVSLSEKTIIGVRLVKDAIRRYGSILKIPITGKLLKSVSKSYSFYKEEKMKDVKEQTEKRTQCESQQLTKKFKSETKDKLAELENCIKSLRNDLKIAQALLNEGNERLQKAIKRKDFKEMSIASSMIESGTMKVKSQTEKLEEAERRKSKLNSI